MTIDFFTAILIVVEVGTKHFTFKFKHCAVTVCFVKLLINQRFTNLVNLARVRLRAWDKMYFTLKFK
ncbi:hypothetical protein SS7213T_05822, partial [Staphylococcus simiae CCM 7213 = CCUG 51256]